MAIGSAGTERDLEQFPEALVDEFVGFFLEGPVDLMSDPIDFQPAILPELRISYFACHNYSFFWYFSGAKIGIFHNFAGVKL